MLNQFQIKALPSLARLRLLNIRVVCLRRLNPRRLDFILDLKLVLLCCTILPCLFLLNMLITTAVAHATATREWTEKNLGDSGAGSYEGVMYSDRGRLAPGIRTDKKLYKDDLSFWTGTYEKNGDLLAGGGSPPFVVRLNKEGSFMPITISGLAKDGKDASSSVTVLRSISANMVVGGFSGNGVVAIKKAEKPNEFVVLCKLPVRGIWDLVEGDNGFLYAATGPLGQIYRINLSTGTFDLWAQVKDTNVRTLCWSKGRLLAGGGDSGNLYQIRGKDKIETLHHFEEESVQRIVEYKDNLVVAVNKLRTPADEKAEDSYKKYFKKLTDMPQVFGIDERMAAPPDPMRTVTSNYASGAVYLIGKEYRIDRLALLKNEHIMDVRVDADGRIYLASGPSGRIYMVRANPDERELWTVQELEYVNVTAILVKDGFPRAFLASGHEAVAYVRNEKQGRTGSFKTRLYSPGRPALWGALSWRGTGVKVYTRNGHSPKPDATWTKWLERTNGVANESSKAWSFAQIRIDMDGKAEFYGFSWRFAEKNQRPEIKSLTIGDRELAKGGAQRQITWEASDPNGDKLEYRLALKEESVAAWQDVSGPSPLFEAKFTLPVGQSPDGRYYLRLTASDVSSNYGAPLTTSRTSPLFIINNGRPEIQDMAIDPVSGRLTAKIRDKLSVISELAVAVDGGEWRSVSPVDGILDEKSEDLRIILSGVTAGRHTVSIKAVNEAGGETVVQKNIAFDREPFPVPTQELIVDDEAVEGGTLPGSVAGNNQ
jgi:hypothetical protein